MPLITYFPSRSLLITGSGGFIGQHLIQLLTKSDPHQPENRAVDISSREQVRQLASELRPRRIIHLASRGTVITPLSLLPAMLDTCVDGLVNLLEEIAPDQIVFASTCSVYGNAPQEGASPVWDDVHPVSIYGLTKAVGELAIHQWVEASGGSGVILRMGNIVGTGGKGLIPYLVRHAIRFPDGSEPVQMRGGGRIIRDYVPVEYAVQVMQASIDSELRRGKVETYNVGSGHAFANGDIADWVRQWLSERGYKLNIVFSDEIASGESWSATLKTQSTSQQFSLPVPSALDVRRAVEAMVEFHFNKLIEQEQLSTINA